MWKDGFRPEARSPSPASMHKGLKEIEGNAGAEAPPEPRQNDILAWTQSGNRRLDYDAQAEHL